MIRTAAWRAATLLLLLFMACSSHRPATVVLLEEREPPPPKVGDVAARLGDEIVVCGRMVHTGAPVVLWSDPGGYDAYRVFRRFSPNETRPTDPDVGCDTANRYGVRPIDRLDKAEQERVRSDGWDLDALAKVVDTFVIHYDVCGVSRQCFRILHDVRGLSVHFMLDVDGTIYQTLDLKERARHAGAANDRSIGVEIAQIGAYDPDSVKDRALLATWYRKDETGGMRIHLPMHLGDPHLRLEGFVPRPARAEPVTGEVQGRRLVQWDFTEEQYRSLTHLTAALCTVLPKIRPDAPRAPDGSVRNAVLSEAEFAAHSGLVGHYHITSAKVDPGPAFDWERVLSGARSLMARKPGEP